MHPNHNPDVAPLSPPPRLAPAPPSPAFPRPTSLLPPNQNIEYRSKQHPHAPFEWRRQVVLLLACSPSGRPKDRKAARASPIQKQPVGRKAVNAGMAGIDERQHAAGVKACWTGWKGGWSWWEWVAGASAGPARDGGGGGAPPPSLRFPFPFPTKPTPARASQSPNQSKSSISLAHAPCLLALGATGRGSAAPRAAARA